MAAPKGNKHALGNRGGKPYSAKNRRKAATLKGLVLDWAVDVMQIKFPKKPKPLKNEQKNQERLDDWLRNIAELKSKRHLVITKILPTCIAREIDLGTGDGDVPILHINLSGKKEK